MSNYVFCPNCETRFNLDKLLCNTVRFQYGKPNYGFNNFSCYVCSNTTYVCKPDKLVVHQTIEKKTIEVSEDYTKIAQEKFDAIYEKNCEIIKVINKHVDKIQNIEKLLEGKEENLNYGIFNLIIQRLGLHIADVVIDSTAQIKDGLKI
jgi:hypothetical protein